MKDPEFRAEYEALEGEFALASALIEARGRAGMTQAQVAEAMGTTQAAIARLEDARVKPSPRTLERFAQARGTRLRIRFEPTQRSGDLHGRLVSAADVESCASPVDQPQCAARKPGR